MSAPAASALGGWSLALDRAPLFLAHLTLFFLPLLVEHRSVDPILVKDALLRTLVALLLVAWLAGAVHTGRLAAVRTPTLFAALLLAAWWIACAAKSPRPEEAFAGLAAALGPLLWFLLLTFTAREAWRGENLLLVFLAGQTAAAVWGIAQAVGVAWGPAADASASEFGGRAVGGAGSPGNFTVSLLAAWPWPLALALGARSRWGRNLGFLSAALILLGLLAAGVPVGFWALGAGTGTFLWFLPASGPAWLRTARRWSARAATFLLVLSAAVVSLRSGGFPTRIFDRPLFGFGPGVFPEGIPSVTAWWAVALQTGIPGLLLLWVLAAATWKPWWRLYRSRAVPPALGAASFAALSGAVVFGFLSPLRGGIEPAVLYLFLAALSVPLSRRFHEFPGFPARYVEWTHPFVRPFALAVLLLIALPLFSWVGDAWKAHLEGIRSRHLQVSSPLLIDAPRKLGYGAAGPEENRGS